MDKDTTKDYVVVQITTNTVTLRAKYDKDGKHFDVDRSDVSNAEIADVGCMVKDIEKLANDRGTRNLVHADRHPIITVYAKKFAEHYKKATMDAFDVVFQKLATFYDKVFSMNISDTAKSTAGRLRQRMRDEEDCAIKMASDACKAIADHNMEPDLVFSPNEHYLNSLVQKMVGADTGMTSDSGGARHIYHNVRAYIKVQRKYISELASKEVIRISILETGSRFDKLLSSKIGKPDLLDLIKEPSKVARERQTLSKRKKVLEEALTVAKKPRHSFQ
jgi:hypothetical protein